MADLIEAETYEAGITQIEITDPVIGGADGKSNQQAKQLANRTKWLKAKIDALIAGSITAAKAVQLATSRKINGVDFNGTADITIYDGTKIGSANIHSAEEKTSVGDDDEFLILDGSSSFGVKKIKKTGLSTALKSSTGIRQTVQYSRVDSSGAPNFLAAGIGLSIDIFASTHPISLSAAGGSLDNDRIGFISANTSLGGLSANATNFIFADVAANGTVTLGSTTLAPVYQFGGAPAFAPSSANGQFTFQISNMTAYLGNGTTYGQCYRVYIGEAVTGASSVTSIVNYVLNGVYDSGWTNTIPSAGTLISKNCNIGIEQQRTDFLVKCIVADQAYPVGTVLRPHTSTASGDYMPHAVANTKNNVTIKTGANGSAITVNNSTGLNGVLTATSWAYKIIAERGW